MDWLQVAKERQDELIQELQELVQINSVLDEKTITADVPFGEVAVKGIGMVVSERESTRVTNKKC
ncbi:Dipeptidase PepV OS=Lysinibacillus sphaericus OX=1421 GN=LS41612_06105 PE=4 SV=1 [Lysinibacillus sphaericus]